MHSPVCTSHTLMVASALDVTINEPSVLNVADKTQPSCPLRTVRHLPVCASHTLMFSSWLAETISEHSVLNAADKTFKV